MQAVASFVARATHPDIHVEYPTPKGFLPNYSSGIAGAWLLRFGYLGPFVMNLRQSIVELQLGLR
jgi:hypothetical protein